MNISLAGSLEPKTEWVASSAGEFCQ